MATTIHNAVTNRWFATIEGLEGIEFKLKSFTIPSLNLGMIELGGSDMVGLKEAGERLMIDDIMLEYVVDADFANYEASINWLKSSITNGTADVRNITIELLSPQRKRMGVAIEYRDCFGIALTPLMLDNDGGVEMVATLTAVVGDLRFIRD